MAGHLRRSPALASGRGNAARDHPRNGASNEDLVVNDAALTYRRLRALADPFLAALATHPTRNFADTGTWHAHLTARGFDARRNTRPGAGRHRRRAVGCDPASRPHAEDDPGTLLRAGGGEASRRDRGPPPPDDTTACPRRCLGATDPTLPSLVHASCLRISACIACGADTGEEVSHGNSRHQPLNVAHC